jgi:glycosyltransferase involved in cell wall biosynthesis
MVDGDQPLTHRISVIMPSMNMGRFLDAALRSIRLQEVPVHEVILIDCGSTDETLEVVNAHIASGLRVRVLYQLATGPGPARNKGIAAAEGDLMAFLDADDLWTPGKLKRQVGRLAVSPHVDMVSGYVCYFDEASEDGLVPRPGSRTERLFHVHVGACIYRKEVFDRLGGPFDEDFRYSEDVDLLLRVREAAVPFTILRSVELYYRQHPASMMAQKDPRREADFRLAARKSLLRRRAKGVANSPLRDFASYLEPKP